MNKLNPIYLDNAASTSVNPGVLAKFNEVAKNLYGNPSSQHMAGILAQKAVSNAQDIIASKLSCTQDEIIFTSGATMSNNILIQGMFRKHPETMFITSEVEHNDIMMLYNWLPYTKRLLSVNENGIVNLKQLNDLIQKCKDVGNYCLVSVQMANSETGIVQPIKEISEIIHQHDKAFLHSDATQYIPYYPVDVNKLNIDAMSMSAQKIGGIKGSGLLYCRESCQKELKPIIFGEQGLVGGTTSTPLVASLGKAFELLSYDNHELIKKRDYLLLELEKLGGILVGTKDNRLPNNIYIRFPNINGLTLMNLLSEYDVYVGTGSACSTTSDNPSHVSLSYGLTTEEALECVRFTLSADNTYEEIEYVVNILKGILPLL